MDYLQKIRRLYHLPEEENSGFSAGLITMLEDRLVILKRPVEFCLSELKYATSFLSWLFFSYNCHNMRSSEIPIPF